MMIVGDCVTWLSPTMETELLLFYLCSCQGIIHVNTGSGILNRMSWNIGHAIEYELGPIIDGK